MFSKHKVLIRIAEWLALVAGAGCACLAIAVTAGLMPPDRIEPLLGPFMFVTFAVLIAAFVLSYEFARLFSDSTAWFQEIELSFAETKLMLHWSPKAFKLAFFVAVALFVYTGFELALVQRTVGQHFGVREARVFLLFMTAFMLIGLPVLASASRMPGSFADHFSSDGTQALRGNVN